MLSSLFLPSSFPFFFSGPLSLIFPRMATGEIGYIVNGIIREKMQPPPLMAFFPSPNRRGGRTFSPGFFFSIIRPGNKMESKTSGLLPGPFFPSSLRFFFWSSHLHERRDPFLTFFSPFLCA